MFRFTIRELVLLTIIVAMGVGWWLDHRRQERNYNALHRATDYLWRQGATPWSPVSQKDLSDSVRWAAQSNLPPEVVPSPQPTSPAEN